MFAQKVKTKVFNFNSLKNLSSINLTMRNSNNLFLNIKLKSMFFCFIFFFFSFNLSLYPQIKLHSNPIIHYNSITFNYYDLYATHVELKSSFDGWKYKYRFKKRKGILWTGHWKLVLPLNNKNFHLKKGKYYYKILVDNIFVHDKNNLNQEKDKLGNLISYFHIQEDLINFSEINKNPIKDSKKNVYRFIYKGSPHKKVTLIGNFNNWNPYSHPLTYIGNNLWQVKVLLIPGKYYYNFIVNDRWEKDTLNPHISKSYPNFSFIHISGKEQVKNPF